jgi:hypothetical protein
MKFANANKLDRKSGGSPTIALKPVKKHDSCFTAHKDSLQ